MNEISQGVHRKFTPAEKKLYVQQKVDDIALWLTRQRERAQAGEISWGAFDRLVARALIARERKVEWMKKRSLIDALTGIPNRRWFNFELTRELAEAQRSGGQRAVLLMDLDGFKGVNDQYGHKVGDEVLKSVACTLLGQVRAGDFLARFGGEEFAVIVVEPKEGTLDEIGERLRKAVEESRGGEGLPTVTVSVGGSLYRSNEDVKHLIERVDTALYRSKNEGKNRVTIASDS